jgi:recombination associated protein RdgC
MFSNAIIYKLTKLPDGGIAAAEQAMESEEFAPCGASQEKSVGWVPSRGIEHGAFIEAIGGHHIARLAIETKSVPASELIKAVDAQAARIEATTGRKPGKKERREIKEAAKFDLLPKAFPKRKDVMVWIDPLAMRVVLNTASRASADEVVTMLVRSGFTLSMLSTVKHPNTFMHNLLLDEDGDIADFEAGRECELEAHDESKAKASFKNHSLDIDAVRDHLKQGKSVTKLGVRSKHASFVINEGMVLKKICLDAQDDMSAEHDDAFDSDVFLATKLIGELIDDLVLAMDGEIQIEEEA